MIYFQVAVETFKVQLEGHLLQESAGWCADSGEKALNEQSSQNKGSWFLCSVKIVINCTECQLFKLNL
jgi:hypothetical protein